MVGSASHQEDGHTSNRTLYYAKCSKALQWLVPPHIRKMVTPATGRCTMPSAPKHCNGWFRLTSGRWSHQQQDVVLCQVLQSIAMVGSASHQEDGHTSNRTLYYAKCS